MDSIVVDNIYDGQITTTRVPKHVYICWIPGPSGLRNNDSYEVP